MQLDGGADGRGPADLFFSIGPLIGRAAELEALRELLLAPAARMVALTGPAGVGKSRLAVALFEELCAKLDGGCYVDLGRLERGAGLAERLSRALEPADGRLEPEGRPPLARIAEWFGDREALLVLDHCEDLMDEVAALARPLLAECPQLRVLVVGQEAPHLYERALFRLAPLPVPGPDTSPEHLAHVPSVELLLQRARVVRPGFDLTDENRDTVAELCRRLDGLPLAIELAASRLKLLTPGALLDALDEGLDCLYGSRADTLSQHLSMKAAIARSCDRLTETEWSGFIRLAVFTGAFGISAAHAVVPPSAEPVDALLSTLVDKNLLTQEDQGNGELGFSMLGTVRSFALNALRQAGELERVEQAHAAYFLAVAQAAEHELRGPQQGSWSRQLTRWNRELEAAFDFFVERFDGGEAAALATALRPYLIASGRLRDGLDRLNRALAVGGLTREQEAAALEAAAELSVLLREDDAEERVGRARERCRTVGDHRGAAACLHHLGTAAYLRGDLDAAADLLREAAAARRSSGDAHGHGRATRDLAAVRRDLGDLAEAARLADSAIETFRWLGDAREEAIGCAVLGGVAAQRGDLSRAEELVGRALELLADGTEATAVPGCLETAADILARHGRDRERWRRCAVLLSAAGALRGELGVPAPDHLRPALDDLVERARIRLGGAAFGAAWDEGRRTSARRAIATALQPVPQDARTPRRFDLELVSPLTQREHEVAELVAHGLTNREIARRLGIAEWTAVNHLRKIMRKLNCSSRVHVANWVTHRQTQENAGYRRTVS
ncbi:ATP-binding protein [Actinomadura rubrobrunea]|uniref:ATP-binding protein n=1 Tax=Actinomadura rubrobrunea TaxID=115335 RepID=UPI0008326E2B|nr:LuxR C-terminal-related transcriptional regulator [Actinomadura rubrobrunea]